MGSGKRYEKEPKLNIKKIIGVLVAIAVIIMVIISINKLLNQDEEQNKVAKQGYFTAYKDNKWGVINCKGEEVIPCQYEEYITIPDESKDVFLITYDVDYNNNTYKTKALNSSGKELYTDYEEVIAIDNFDEAQNLWYEKNVLKVKKNNKYGLINFEGDELLECQYDDIYSLKGTDNSMIIKKGENVGLVSDVGDIIIKPEYKQIIALGNNYKDGYIVVNNDNKKGIINFYKEQLLDNIYDEIGQVELGKLYTVKQDGILKVLNQNKEVILENKFDEVIDIEGQSIICKKDGKVGVINTSAEQKIPFEYDELTKIWDDNYIAKKNEKYGVINISNEEKVPFEYGSIIRREGTDFIEADKTPTETNVFDKNFKLQLTGIISEVNIENGYIVIRTGSEQKYYNFKFEEKKSSEILKDNTLFLSKKNGKYGYINKEGKVVVDYIYDDAKEQNEYGYCPVKQGNVWGVLNKDGNVLKTPSVNLENNLIINFIGNWHLSEDLTMNYYEQ